FDDDELQRGAGAPEQGGDGQRDLAELVAPEQLDAVGEFVDQIGWVLLQRHMVDAGLRDMEVEEGCDQVKAADDQQIDFRRAVDARLEQGEIEIEQGGGNIRVDEDAAENRAEDDGAHGQAFDPAVGHDQEAMGQVFGENAV